MEKKLEIRRSTSSGQRYFMINTEEDARLFFLLVIKYAYDNRFIYDQLKWTDSDTVSLEHQCGTCCCIAGFAGNMLGKIILMSRFLGTLFDCTSASGTKVIGKIIKCLGMETPAQLAERIALEFSSELAIEVKTELSKLTLYISTYESE